MPWRPLFPASWLQPAEAVYTSSIRALGESNVRRSVYDPVHEVSMLSACPDEGRQIMGERVAVRSYVAPVQPVGTISAPRRMIWGVWGGGTGFVRLAKSVDGEQQCGRWAHPFVKVGSTHGFGDW